MAVQLKSGKEMSNNRVEEKGKTDKKEVKETGGDNGRSKTEKTIEIEKQMQTEQPERSVSRNRKIRCKHIPLQSHFLKGFRKQGRKNKFLNSWKFSRK